MEIQTFQNDRIGQDDADGIVDFMGNAGCHFADGGQPFGIDQPLLQPFSFCQVPGKAADGRIVLVGIEEKRGRNFHGARFVVLQTNVELSRSASMIANFVQEILQALPGFRINELEKIARWFLVGMQVASSNST